MASLTRPSPSKGDMYVTTSISIPDALLYLIIPRIVSRLLILVSSYLEQQSAEYLASPAGSYAARILIMTAGFGPTQSDYVSK